jgi:hypothetical protein
MQPEFSFASGKAEFWLLHLAFLHPHVLKSGNALISPPMMQLCQR